MKPITKAICSAKTEGKVWKKHLHKLLLNYQTTPCSTTKFSLVELLFNRKINNKLSHLHINSTPKLQSNHEKAKDKMNADIGNKVKPSHIEIDELALA